MGQYSSWYADRKWRAKRLFQLQKEPLCAYCQNKGIIKEAEIADHITPHRGDRKKFWYGELQSLCQECHSSTKQIEESSPSRLERRKYPEHHWNK